LETVERIAEALELSLAELFSESDFPRASLARECSCSDGIDISRYVCVRNCSEESAHDAMVLEEIVVHENASLALEALLKISSATKLQFVHSFRVDSNGAKMLARSMRSACAAGPVAFQDLAEMLELKNVRLHIIDLPKGVSSRSYYDIEHHTLSIVLAKADTSERQLYRIAYEFGWAMMFGSAGFKTISESPLRHRFARVFASEFLMPEEVVVFTVSQLGIRPGDWTLGLISQLKLKFGVSAEAFALRLESLGLISEDLRVKLRDEVRAYYRKHPKAMEPKPSLLRLKIGERRKILEMAAGRVAEK
jgi:Zn-dependent peptidase ImmA (M78 family)